MPAYLGFNIVGMALRSCMVWLGTALAGPIGQVLLVLPMCALGLKVITKGATCVEPAHVTQAIGSCVNVHRLLHRLHRIPHTATEQIDRARIASFTRC